VPTTAISRIKKGPDQGALRYHFSIITSCV
jgi:hypothetical protein